MKSTICLGENQSLVVQPHGHEKLILILYASKQAALPDFMLGLRRDQVEALVFGLEAALESAMPLPAMGELAKV